MNEPETVFRLRPLDTEHESEFLLSVFMPIPFGMGKNVFQVDALMYDKPSRCFYALKGDKKVVQFPDTFQHLLIHRNNYEVISMEEAKKVMAEAEKDEKEEGGEEYISPTKYL